MKSKSNIWLTGAILLTCLLLPLRVHSQSSPFDPLLTSQASQIKEHVDVFTDRGLYVVNEEIFFRADIGIQGMEEGREWSSVLYAELVTGEGLSIAGGKFSLVDGFTQGRLPIPRNTLTGWYYLKCYTRWMRNLGPEVYSYMPLRIINPLTSQLEAQSRKRSSPGEGLRSTYSKKGIVIEHPGFKLARGQKVEVNLRLSDENSFSAIHSCVTVVPEQACDSMGAQMFQAPPSETSESFKLNFLPDLFGPTLSGTTNPGQRIHLSFLRDPPNYYATLADDFGRFTFALPDRKGLQELFITPEANGDQTAEVRVDQEFDQEKVLLTSPPFDLTKEELETATLMARRVQLARAFQAASPVDKLPIRMDSLPFYGEASLSVELNEFISLPTLSEVFINLVPTVLVLKKKEQTRLLVLGDNPALKVYPPLLLVDQIPLFDHQKVLDIPPEKIRRIDVINDVYVKGQFYHGGIINLVSHQDDMGGIDLPDGSYFFDYQGIIENSAHFSETWDRGSRIPDSRNTVCWIPDLTLTKGEGSKLKFIAPDYPGSYVILVRGVAPNGEILSGTAHFEVE